MNPQGTHVICPLCDSRVMFVKDCCPKCGYVEWDCATRQAIVNAAHEVDSWCQDAVGDMAGSTNEMAKFNADFGDPKWKKKIKKAEEYGVQDLVGWLADEYYDDEDTLSDLTGDRIHDETYNVVRVMDQQAGKPSSPARPPEYVRLQIQIAICKEIAGSAHESMKRVMIKSIENARKRLFHEYRQQLEAEAAAFGDSQIKPSEGTNESSRP